MENLTTELTRLQLRLVQLRTSTASDGHDGSADALGDLESAVIHLQQAQGAMQEQQEQRAQLRAATERTLAERRRADDLLAAASEALVVTDGRGVIHEANRNACAMFGVDGECIVGKPLSTYVRGDDPRGIERALERLGRGRTLESWRIVLAPRGRPALRGTANVASQHDPDGEVQLRWHFRAVPDGRPPNSAEESVVIAAAGLHGVCGAALLRFEAETVVVASSDVLQSLAHVQIEASEGPALDACSTGVAIAEGDLYADGGGRWSRWGKTARDVPVGAVLSIPVVSGDHGVGALEIYRDAPGEFEQPVVSGAAALASLIGSVDALKGRVGELRTLTDQLQHALESRVVVEQAKGVLSERLNIAPAQAFEIMRQQARGSRRKLRDVAGEVLGDR